MTQKEITRLRVINQTIDGVLTIREAADLLGLSERVEKEKIDKILTGALTAPSGRNIKPWELIVVDDKEIIQKLAASRGPASRPLANAPLAIVVAANPELTDRGVLNKEPLLSCPCSCNHKDININPIVSPYHNT